MAQPCAAIILAAGESSRFRSGLPKVAHPLVGRPMLNYLTDTLRQLELARCLTVVGHGRETVTALLPPGYEAVVQTEQRGTGDAAATALRALGDFAGDVLILCGDVPLVSRETLQRLLDVHRQEHNSGTVLTVRVEDPTGLGRIVRDLDGRVQRIVEEADAVPHERAIKEINTGTYVFAAPELTRLVGQLTCNNQQQEYYLTDIIEKLQCEGRAVGAVLADDPLEVMGINHRVHLAQVEAVLRRRINEGLMRAGVTLIDPAATYIEAGVQIGSDTVIWPQTVLTGATSIGPGCTICGPTRIHASVIGADCRIEASVLTGAQVGDGTTIGPFAHLREGTVLAGQNRVGNFVETKKLTAGAGTKMSHLSYLGDAQLGCKVNIGAGTITCNYDGFAKHPTVIGDRVFVGSDVQFVAPVTVGDDAVIAAGTTVTQPVPAGALALTRPPQINREGYAARRRARKEHQP
ncbi:MAG TPA: bifunctional UDP-N-acetylglucosamine diphosphorylase/glucosamine-1-phosphate N-acetyltransferase GlmU [bacterium]|nr:bifunctional UDP-N-acetylglucosamine diphosphorylase/glucosamine-1-phosphate N-acetyltransferase GlmU [bacterium]